MSEEEDAGKPVYYVEGEGGELGFAFVAKGEEEAVEHAKSCPDMTVDEELVSLHQVTRDGETVLVDDKEYGDKIGLEEGLHKGIYSYAVGIDCERCDDPTDYIVEYKGKLVCDKCRAELEEE